MSIVRRGLAQLSRFRSWAARTFLQPSSVTLLSIPSSQFARGEADETAGQA